MGALQAMKKAADRLKAETDRAAGSIAMADGEYRARFQFKDGEGSSREIYGPCRWDERRAQADLEAIKAAGTNRPTRDDVLEAMDAEAHRIQAHAAFEATVAMAIGQQRLRERHLELDPDPDSEGEQAHNKRQVREDEADMMQPSEPTDSENDPFPEYDVSTKEARARLLMTPEPQPPKPKLPEPTNAVEATARLVNFLPAREGVEGLQKLLDARADPNVVVGPTEISPLRKVAIS